MQESVKKRYMQYDPRKRFSYTAQCDNCKIEIDVRVEALSDYVKKRLALESISLSTAGDILENKAASYVIGYMITYCGFTMIKCLDSKKDQVKELLYCYKCSSAHNAPRSLPTR